MQTIDRDRDRKSLQDLAQMAKGMTPPPSSVAAFGPVPSSRSVTNLGADANKKADDSGIVDLAAASAADPQAAIRAQSTPLASQSLFEDVPPPPPVNAPPASYAPPAPAHAYQQPAPSVPPPSVGSVPPPPAHYASVHPIAPSLQKKKSGAGALVFAFGSILALGAAAAGGFVYITKHKAPAPVAAAPAEVKPAVVAENKPAEAPKPADPVAQAEKPSDGATDLNALPSVSNAKSGGKVAVRSSKPSSAAKEPAVAKEPAEDPAEAAKAKADKAKLEKALAGNDAPAAPPAGGGGDLGSALKDAAKGGMMQEQKPAAGSSGGGGNVPQKPSQGAVTGALGAVLPAARECLGPDDPISKASVVFNSDGSVASVSVSGSAAGKPAATCIEKELRKAKLQPFAEPTYTANITIRHN